MYIKQTFLACDVCHESYVDNCTEAKTAKEIRAEDSWYRYKGKDVCWQCFERGAHKETP